MRNAPLGGAFTIGASTPRTYTTVLRRIALRTSKYLASNDAKSPGPMELRIPSLRSFGADNR